MKTAHRKQARVKRKWQADPTAMGRVFARIQPYIPTMAIAKAKSTRLTAGEVDNTMKPSRLCLVALREGRASESHHCILHTVIALAEVIEEQGIVRGLQHYWEAADKALAAIWQRARAHGKWQPPVLRGSELTAITEAIDLHAWQIAQLSAGELASAARLLIARTQTAKRPVLRTTMQALEAQP